MTLVKNTLEKRIASAQRDQIGDINWAASILETMCDMTLEDYIKNCLPGIHSQNIKRLLEYLELDSFEACYITFGEVCEILSKKWAEISEGELPDESMMEMMAYLVPVKEGERL